MAYYKIEDRSKILDDFKIFIDNFKIIKDKACLNNITNTISENEVQNLIYSLSGYSKNTNLISKMIARECIRSETSSSGSAVIILRLILYYFSRMENLSKRKDRLGEIEKIRKEIIDSSIFLNKFLRQASKKDVYEIICNLNLSPSLTKIMHEVIFNLRIGQKIDVKRSNRKDSYTTVRPGNYIDLKVPQIFLKNIDEWNRDSVNVLLIDGTIEKISSFHHLLEKAASEKNPYLVICQKVSQEVRETIDLNFIRDTLDIVLVEIDFDLKFHHLIKDISSLFNVSFVNIQMGDIISSKIEKLIFVVDHIKINQSGITFTHQNLDNDFINKYIKDIRSIVDKIAVSDIDSISDITKSVNDRIKFLQSGEIEFMIGEEDIFHNDQSISKIDTFFRSIPDMNLTGILDGKNYKGDIDKISSIIFNSNKSKLFTQRQVFQSLLASLKLYEMILKAEKIFTIEK